MLVARRQRPEWSINDRRSTFGRGCHVAEAKSDGRFFLVNWQGGDRRARDGADGNTVADDKR
jgi:hypothetical protein